jgi:integrase
MADYAPAEAANSSSREHDRTGTLEEEQKLLSVAKGYLRPLIMLLVDTGLRVGKEALSLRWDALDLESENPVVRVRSSKTSSGIRIIPLTGRLKAKLSRWRRLTESFSEFVFFYPRNPAKYLLQVPKTWKRALKEARVERRRIYDLRSTFATRLNAAGVPQVFIDQLMGHAGGRKRTRRRAMNSGQQSTNWKGSSFQSSKR